MNVVWYKLIYRMESGHSINWFNGDFDFILDFFNNISGKTIGNFLMFLPFGVLISTAFLTIIKDIITKSKLKN